MCLPDNTRIAESYLGERSEEAVRVSGGKQVPFRMTSKVVRVKG